MLWDTVVALVAVALVVIVFWKLPDDEEWEDQAKAEGATPATTTPAVSTPPATTTPAVSTTPAPSAPPVAETPPPATDPKPPETPPVAPAYGAPPSA